MVIMVMVVLLVVSYSTNYSITIITYMPLVLVPAVIKKLFLISYILYRSALETPIRFIFYIRAGQLI